MAVRVISDGPMDVMVCACTKCGYELEFTFDDVSHNIDRDDDAIETKGLYIMCPRVQCNERVWIGYNRADAKARCCIVRRSVTIVTDALIKPVTAPVPVVVYLPRLEPDMNRILC